MTVNWKRIFSDPSFLIFLSFGGAILIGAVLLSSSWCVNGELTFVDALFTATSAVCVTGLIVQDTATFFTIPGQFVILSLFQLGGIGILTLSAFFLSAMTGRLGLRSSNLLEHTLSENLVVDFLPFLKRVFLFVFASEAIGAAILTGLFLFDHPLLDALWLGIFHSVSAFCNAGFSIFSTSLEGYVDSTSVNFVIMTLVVLGGIGFVVIEDIAAIIKNRDLSSLSFHSKAVLTTTVALILAGWGVIYGVESSAYLEGSDGSTKLLVSLFQSVTARTAGFNTVPIHELAESSLFFMMFLMFIGGSPGSCAGGIKTTSFAVFFALVSSRLRGRKNPELFGRTVSPATLDRLMTLLVSGGIILSTAIFILLITETGMPYDQEHPRAFLAIAFEVISAFGTVGLSMGVTPYLSEPGKLIICVLMFLGRIGPLTLILVLMRPRKGHRFSYPEEDIIIG